MLDQLFKFFKSKNWQFLFIKLSSIFQEILQPFDSSAFYDTLYAQLRAYLFVIKCKVFKMHGEGIQRIQFPDKKRHNELSDGGMRKFHLVSKVNNEKSASSSRVIY